MSAALLPARVQNDSPIAFTSTLRDHWPEYLMELSCFGSLIFLVCLFTVLLEHPSSPLHLAIANPLLRRGLRGIATGLAAIALIHSTWGKRSGAHLNPSVTLTYFTLG